MPSTFDDGKNYRQSAAVYDQAFDQKMSEHNRVLDTVLEPRVPPVPTREQETEYLDFFEDSVKSDRWLTTRYHKLKASPKRIPWKNSQEIQSQYRFNFYVNWFIGGVLAWPAAVVIGRRMKTLPGGVPVYPVQRFIDDWPNVEPARHARRTFFFWAVGTSVVAGYVFAKYFCDGQTALNVWHNRPDLKPFAAMVDPAYDQGKDGIAYKSMREQEYWSQKMADASADRKRSSWYRYFFAMDADFTVKSNPYAHHSKHDIYNPKKGYITTPYNDYLDHVQK